MVLETVVHTKAHFGYNWIGSVNDVFLLTEKQTKKKKPRKSFRMLWKINIFLRMAIFILDYLFSALTLPRWCTHMDTTCIKQSPSSLRCRRAKAIDQSFKLANSETMVEYAVTTFKSKQQCNFITLNIEHAHYSSKCSEQCTLHSSALIEVHVWSHSRLFSQAKMASFLLSYIWCWNVIGIYIINHLLKMPYSIYS